MPAAALRLPDPLLIDAQEPPDGSSEPTRAWTVVESRPPTFGCSATRTIVRSPETVRMPKSVSADAIDALDKNASPIANRVIDKPPLVQFAYTVEQPTTMTSGT